MRGIESIDFSLENVFTSWHKFKVGKTNTNEFYDFQYSLEQNLFLIHQELNSLTYKHGKYQFFEVNDNKKRSITVASIKDRVVHRLLYDHLVSVYDKTFIYDVWSCRKDKGLHSAVLRTQVFARKNEFSYFWRADIKKFFNSIDIQILYNIVSKKVKCKNCLWLLKEVLASFNQNGIPIGNLTSQVLANIYLNELDQFIKHRLKQKYYLRYGDDFIIFLKNKKELESVQKLVTYFLNKNLNLQLSKIGGTYKVRQSINFLGMIITPFDLKLNKRIYTRIFNNLNIINLPSYIGVAKITNRIGLKNSLQLTVNCKL